MVAEYSGSWGTLAVSQDRYQGLEPVENEEHIFVIIGGPVLTFADNNFLTGESTNAGTQLLYERWLAGDLDWAEDLSGPFCALIVDKQAKTVDYVTDLMGFVPIYAFADDHERCIATHIDALAKVTGQQGKIDEVSVVDFILHDVVTFPYTTYSGIRQSFPATHHRYEKGRQYLESSTYWQPLERAGYASLEEAARALRDGIQSYVETITRPMQQVAQFISGGEDSRVLSGLLPSRLHRDGFIFLDSMNREGKVAAKVAAAYGVNFKPQFRGPAHYLDILPEASDLVGFGHQYSHAHTLGFDKLCKLADYSAVFGGFYADSLLKSDYARTVRDHTRLPFWPQRFRPGETRSQPLHAAVFEAELVAQVHARRVEHVQRIKAFRPETVHEWFAIWPASMRKGLPNLYTTRRLFASYEPFMCHEAVKVSAAVPTEWKLNRRMFHQATQPYLKASQWLPHADGYWPYFSASVNAPVYGGIWLGRKLGTRLKLIKANQGPWGSWRNFMRDKRWREALPVKEPPSDVMQKLLCERFEHVTMQELELTKHQKRNLLQVLYHLSRLT